MTGSKRSGRRRGRVALFVAIAATAVTALGVSSAQAADGPFGTDFNDAALHLPAPAGTSDILDVPPSDPATLDGTITGTALTAGALDFPGFDGELSGFPLHVEFAQTAPITGTLDASGNMTTAAATYETVVSLLGATCTYHSTESFKTAAGSPFNGAPFSGQDPATGGVVQTSWNTTNHFSLVDSTGDCSLITNVINSGCGGLALANTAESLPTDATCTTVGGGGGGGGTTTPPPSNPPAKKKAKCKKKKGKKGSAQSAKKKKCKKGKKK
jgi:hypothetical protein